MSSIGFHAGASPLPDLMTTRPERSGPSRAVASRYASNWHYHTDMLPDPSVGYPFHQRLLVPPGGLWSLSSQAPAKTPTIEKFLRAAYSSPFWAPRHW